MFQLLSVTIKNILLSVSTFVKEIILLRNSILKFNSKTVQCSPMHKEGNELCIIYQLIYGSVL